MQIILQYQVLSGITKFKTEIAIKKIQMKINANEIKPGMIIEHKDDYGMF